MSDHLDFLHTDHSWHGVNDEGNWGAGYWVRPGRVKELLAEQGLCVVREGEVPPWMEQVPNGWVYTGPDVYVEGVPFGDMQHQGEGFSGTAWEDQREPVYRLIGTAQSDLFGNAAEVHCEDVDVQSEAL